MNHKEVIVVGSGLAGLCLALKIADQKPVTLISKVSLEGTNTGMAQGGVAAALEQGDSADKHFQDTLTAGAGLCRPEVVRIVTDQARDRIYDLVKWGVQFDKDPKHPDRFALGKEGGHSERRILHISDHTGQSIHRHLLQLAINHPNIEIIENHFAIDLVMRTDVEPYYVGSKQCVGVKLLDTVRKTHVFLSCSQVVLATGGAGKAYLYTSNWEGATGDGIAMAHRAGARVSHLEFMQFHPTCLYDARTRNFLISEALRGEGGILINKAGENFTLQYHPLGSLAPRDIVARAIDSEMKKSGAECVHLDMTHLSRDFIMKRFPVIYQKCLNIGIDMAQQPIPVVPAAHYLCGGVLTTVAGETDILNLYCLGEAACTGLHGANRLASNSLLECLVTAHLCAQKIFSLQTNSRFDMNVLRSTIGLKHETADELIVVHHMWDEIRRLMWNYVGIVRSDRRLQRALHRLELIQQEISEYYSRATPHSDVEELRNIALVAELTVRQALKRKQSIGIHYNIDHPNREEIPHTMLDET